MALRINSPVKFRFPSGKAKKAGRDHGSDPAIVRQNVPAPLILVGLIPGA
jgi:hypothetical protein